MKFNSFLHRYYYYYYYYYIGRPAYLVGCFDISFFQVKLHGAKSSLILLVYRASAKSITLKTLVSARQNQHEEGGAQQTHNEPASRSPAPTVDESTLFSTALDGDQGTPSPLSATPILLPDSLDNVTHELPASSFSRNGPIVLRYGYATGVQFRDLCRSSN